QDERNDRGREQRAAPWVGVLDRLQEVDRAATLKGVAKGDRHGHVTRLVPGRSRAVDEDPDRVAGGGDQGKGDRRPDVPGVEPGAPGHGRKTAAFSFAEV